MIDCLAKARYFCSMATDSSQFRAEGTNYACLHRISARMREPSERLMSDRDLSLNEFQLKTLNATQ